MARKLNKSVDVQKFGGVDELGVMNVDGQNQHVSHIEAKSEETHLEDDLGTGKPLVMRSFTFKIDQEAFKVHVPTKQELFNSHAKGLELSLWKDGLIFEQSHEPHILFNKKRTHYTIFIVATPSRGNVLTETPQTLTQIING